MELSGAAQKLNTSRQGTRDGNFAIASAPKKKKGAGKMLMKYSKAFFRVSPPRRLSLRNQIVDGPKQPKHRSRFSTGFHPPS